MKRWLTTLLLVLAVAAAVGTVFWRHILPRWQVSDIYRHYEHVDGIAASYIHNYPVNDTLTLFVTLLEATSDSGWAVLVRDFEMDELSPLLQMLIDRGENLVFSKLIPKSRPSPSAGNDVLAYSYATRTVSIFHLANDEEKQAVLYHNIKESFDQDN
jgi:hypothetical protein